MRIVFFHCKLDSCLLKCNDYLGIYLVSFLLFVIVNFDFWEYMASEAAIVTSPLFWNTNYRYNSYFFSYICRFAFWTNCYFHFSIISNCAFFCLALCCICSRAKVSFLFASLKSFAFAEIENLDEPR